MFHSNLLSKNLISSPFSVLSQVACHFIILWITLRTSQMIRRIARDRTGALRLAFELQFRSLKNNFLVPEDSYNAYQILFSIYARVLPDVSSWIVLLH